jgi:hypothetical protein
MREDNIHAVLETLDGFVKAGKSSILGCQMKIHGESCVFEEQYNNLPRVKRFKTRILIEPSFENASAEVCLRKCGLAGVFTNGFYLKF